MVDQTTPYEGASNVLYTDSIILVNTAVPTAFIQVTDSDGNEVEGITVVDGDN